MSVKKLLKAIVENDYSAVEELLKRDTSLAKRLIAKPILYRSGIFHWIYVGDTPLHLAAAGYCVEIVRLLLASGADPNAAGNRRRSSPLHYAADGFITGLKCGKGRTVMDCARSVWIRQLLAGSLAERGSPPNGGPAKRHGNSEISEGPPSVS